MARGEAGLDRRRASPAPEEAGAEAAADARARSSRALEKPEEPPPKPPPAVHGRLRRRARRRGQARQAGDRDHRGDGGRDRPDQLAEELPEQYYDVGIAEQDAVLFASGLAIQGAKPVCAIYSTFLQRAYDQIVHDVCLQKLNVVFAMDRAGLVGDDGPTHHGAFDVSYFRALPNVVVMAPARRGDARPHAAHGARPRRRPDRLPLPARHRRGRAAARPRPRDPDRHRRGAARRASGSRCSATATASRSRSTPPRCSREHGLALDRRRRAASPSRSTAS